jgi:hypothetical protein
LFQLIGQIGLLLTVPKMLAWAFRLKRGPIEVYPSLQTVRIPMIDAASGQEINWAIEHLPSLKQTPRQCGSGHGETAPRIAFSTPVAIGARVYGRSSA